MTMMIRTLALIGLLGFGTAATVYTLPAEARTYIGINLGYAPPPPPPRYERVVAREGYVWAPGYWRWNGRRHVWINGYWMRGRPDYNWVGPRWEPYGHRARFHAGYWGRR
jgi:hypothetical protein